MVLESGHYHRAAKAYFEEMADRYNIDPDSLIFTTHPYTDVAQWLYKHQIQNDFLGTLYGKYYAWIIYNSQDRLLFRLAFS